MANDDIDALRRDIEDLRVQTQVNLAATGLAVRVLCMMSDGIKGQFETHLDRIADRFGKQDPALGKALFDFVSLHVRGR